MIITQQVAHPLYGIGVKKNINENAEFAEQQYINNLKKQ